MGRPPSRTRPTIRGRIFAFIVGLLFMLLLAEAILRVLFPHWREFHSGWFMRHAVVPGHGALALGVPGFDGYFAQNNGDFRVRIQINDFGLRNDEPVEASAGRVWIVGDSMAFGWGVARDQTYTAEIARQTGLGTYSVASPGTNVCGYQALLARMPKTVAPKAVIVGLVLENDLSPQGCREWAQEREQSAAQGGPPWWARIEHIWDVKGLMARHLALYNFLAVSIKRVDDLTHLLQMTGLVAEAQPYRRQLEESAVARAIENTADEMAVLRAMLPLAPPVAVLLTPARFEIRDEDSFFAKLRTEMTNALTARGFPVIDPIEKFRAAGFAPTHFAHDGHWSPTGHRLAAEAAAGWLSSAAVAK
ncbi:MAG: hypothetical protein EXQ86_02505 [Rhodospirillales bacterium]|nr:hypothetical protein [Rhodospirillales bacterium]